MVRYLDDTDYSPVIREEIKAILTIAGEDALIRAEEFAIGEILSYLGAKNKMCGMDRGSGGVEM